MFSLAWVYYSLGSFLSGCSCRREQFSKKGLYFTLGGILLTIILLFAQQFGWTHLAVIFPSKFIFLGKFRDAAATDYTAFYLLRFWPAGKSTIISFRQLHPPGRIGWKYGSVYNAG